MYFAFIERHRAKQAQELERKIKQLQDDMIKESIVFCNVRAEQEKMEFRKLILFFFDDGVGCHEFETFAYMSDGTNYINLGAYYDGNSIWSNDYFAIETYNEHLLDFIRNTQKTYWKLCKEYIRSVQIIYSVADDMVDVTYSCKSVLPRNLRFEGEWESFAYMRNDRQVQKAYREYVHARLKEYSITGNEPKDHALMRRAKAKAENPA